MRRTFLIAVSLLVLAGCHIAGPEHFVVYFQTKSSHLDTQGGELIASIAEKARQRPGTPVVLSGYTAPAGSVADNLMLAAQRTQTVADALIKAGVDPATIRRRSMGGVDFSMDSIESRRVEIALGEK
jgi:outer membrane protein OmpA-like peptidoglycan-associated protein